MNLPLAQLGLPELLVEPDQLAGGIPGGGQQPQVEVVAEVAVDGDDGEARSHLNSGQKVSQRFSVKVLLTL